MRAARRLSFRVLLVALLPSGALADSAFPGGFEDPALRARRTVLENGLTVLTLEDHTTPVVSFQMWVHAGSRDETRYTGLAHLFEHMMFKGSTNVGPGMHASLIESRGGRLNAYTSRDVTVYFGDVTADTLPLVIELEAERVAHLDISERTLASEREVVIEERRMRIEDDPDGRAFEALLATTFVAHPYRRPVIGWMSDLEAIDVAACREFFSTYYAANNLVLALVGPFDTEEALARIERSFGSLEPAAAIPRTPTREPEQRGPRRDTIRFDVRGPILAMAWHAPATGHADGPALDVLSQILSGGRSSRLYRRLVREEEIALHASGRYWELGEAGVFYGSVGIRPGVDVDRAESLFFAEIERLRDEPASEAEVAKAKRQLEVQLLGQLRTSHGLASRIARDTLLFDRIRPLSELLEQIQAVGTADVRRVANLYLTDKGRNVVRVVPPPIDPREVAAGERGP